MSFHFNDVAKQGHVKIKNKIGMWNQIWLILRRPSSKGPLRLDKYADEKASMLGDSSGKAVELKQVREIARLPKDDRKCAIVITFENGKTLQMAMESESEAESWLSVLHEFCTSTGIRSGPPGMDLLSNTNMQDVFNVCLLQTPALNVYGECLLQITAERIILLDVENPRARIVTWPLNALRRYSRDATMFTIESGRSCDTGEGLFIFNTIHGEEIYQKVWSSSNAIAEAYRFMSSRNNAGVQRSPSDIALPTTQRSPIGRPHRSLDLTGQSLDRRPLPPLPSPRIPVPPRRN